MQRPSTPMLGAAYYPEAWDEAQQQSDIAQMVRAGIDVVRIGEFDWHGMEPREGEFDFSRMHRVMDRLRAAGIRVILGTPSAAPPIWLEELDPSMRLLDDQGLRHDHGGRRHCCSNNPTYVRYSLRIAEKMAQEFGRDPNVIGWQIDNEIAAFDYGCFCTHCVRAFEEHLRRRYGTIDELNRRWDLNLFSQAYDDFSQIPQPKPHTWHSPHLKYEWAVFHAESHIRFIEQQAAVLRRYTDAPIGTDMMPVFNQDHEKMNRFLDVVQYNHYDDPKSIGRELFWFDYMRTLRERPFWVTETATCWNGSTSTPSDFREEGFCYLNSWLPIVLGAEANLYWLWRQHWGGHELMHGAVLYASGRPMHIFPEVQRVSADYRKCADFLSDTRVVSDFAIMASTTADYLMKQQEVVWEPDAHQWETAYTKRLYRAYRPIAQMGVRPDVIAPGHALEPYRILFTPFLLTLEMEQLPQRIERWVKDGGIWIVGPMTDIRDEIGAHYTDRETGMLERLTGAVLCHQVPDASHSIRCTTADGEDFPHGRFLQLYDIPQGAQPLATVSAGHSALIGKAVAFRVPCGKGQILVLGTLPEASALQRLLREVPLVRFDADGAIAAAQREGAHARGIAAAEYGGSAGQLRLDKPHIDLISGERCVGEVAFAPYQVRILREA